MVFSFPIVARLCQDNLSASVYLSHFHPCDQFRVDLTQILWQFAVGASNKVNNDKAIGKTAATNSAIMEYVSQTINVCNLLQ